MVSFKVSKIKGTPQFDSLPVAKITEYPLEKRDYKPYAQSILCVSESALTLRMWAFEVSPPETSSLRALLYIFRDDTQRALCVDIFSNGYVHIYLMNAGLPGQEPVGLEKAAFTARPLGGEDLQGVYWGSTVTIPLAALEALGGALRFDKDDDFPGNFYKTCAQEPFRHSGSCFKANFTGNPYTRENMGAFSVVSY